VLNHAGKFSMHIGIRAMSALTCRMITALIFVVTTGENARLLHGRLVHESVGDLSQKVAQCFAGDAKQPARCGRAGSGMPSSTPSRAAPRTKLQVTATGGKQEKRVDTPVQLGAGRDRADLRLPQRRWSAHKSRPQRH
jgi:hypothetical protein